MADDVLLVIHPYRYYDNGLLEEPLEEVAQDFDGDIVRVSNGESGMEPHHGDGFYDDVLEDLDGRGTVDPDDLEADGEVYVSGGLGQKCLYRTVDSLDEDIDGLVPELTYVEAVPVSREDYDLVAYDEQKLRRFGGPAYTDMREIKRLDQVDVEPGELFESAPYDEEAAIVGLDAL
jgi:hypothetical protein